MQALPPLSDSLELPAEKLLEAHKSVHHSPILVRIIVHVVPYEGTILIESPHEEVIIFLVELIEGDHGVSRVEERGGEGCAAQRLASFVRLKQQGKEKKRIERQS